MQEKCGTRETGLFPTQQFLSKPNPVRLPIYKYYPTNPQARSSLFCCRDYTKTPVQFFFKAAIEHIYRSVLDRDFFFTDLHIQVHKNLHRTMDALNSCFEKTGLLRMFERIAITLPDALASDTVITRSLNVENLSYSNASGEYRLSETFLKDVCSLKETDNSMHYSELQLVTQYFLQLIKEHSACQPDLRIDVEEIPGYDSIFMIRTDKIANRAYLPLEYCLGILIGCPYAGFLTSKIWVFKKEMLYLLAKVFGVMEIKISKLLFDAMKQDIVECHQKQIVFCKPLWRMLMAVERKPDESECLSHIPRTSLALVEMSRFAEIVKRSVVMTEYENSEVEKEQSRIVNTYHYSQRGPPTVEMIKAVLMFEKRHLNNEIPQFLPRLKWIHKRLRIAEFEEEHTLEEKRWH